MNWLGVAERDLPDLQGLLEDPVETVRVCLGIRIDEGHRCAGTGESSDGSPTVAIHPHDIVDFDEVLAGGVADVLEVAEAGREVGLAPDRGRIAGREENRATLATAAVGCGVDAVGFLAASGFARVEADRKIGMGVSTPSSIMAITILLVPRVTSQASTPPTSASTGAGLMLGPPWNEGMPKRITYENQLIFLRSTTVALTFGALGVGREGLELRLAVHDLGLAGPLGSASPSA